jgi:hypothetical protein
MYAYVGHDGIDRHIVNMSICDCQWDMVLANEVVLCVVQEDLLSGYKALSSTLNSSKLQVLLVYHVP